MRLKVSHFLALALIAVLSVGLMAGPAAAKPSRAHKLSAKQMKHIRASLKRQVKKNPKVVTRKSFLKKAALVNFELPVTIRLRGVPFSPTIPNPVNGNYAGPIPPANIGGNPNYADVDLGPSLGQRRISLGGSLSGNIVFHDSFDGGALGNVSLELKPDTNGGGLGNPNHSLTTTSIPLLWNQQVTQLGSRYDVNDLGAFDSLYPSATNNSGCADWKVGGNGAFGGNVPANSAPYGAYGALSANWLTFGRGVVPPLALSGVFPGAFTSGGFPGYPYYNNAGTGSAAALGGFGNPNGFLAIDPGLEDITNVKTGDYPGSNNIVGPSNNPFPVGTNPAGFTVPPSAQDTVLRTNALNLGIAPVGSVIQSGTVGDHPSGSHDIVVGKSGGEANLFGNIPGKSYGIDITASFQTKISSIIRVVDQDSFHTKLINGGRWPAGVFNCRQIWTGYVTNYIPGVRLVGNLKIAPGLTSDGHLRIAKAVVGSSTPARFAVAACLSPDSNYAADNPGYSSDTWSPDGPGTVIPDPGTGAFTSGIVPDAGGAKIALPAEEPVLESSTRGAPNYQCNTHQTGLVHYAGLNGLAVPLLAPSVPADGYNTNADGSKVSVGADLNVGNVSVDILIGDV